MRIDRNVLGIISIVFGVLILFNTRFLAYLVGIFLIIWGAANVLSK
jgi:uncharacterized membrane protein HdeD (DUF308 family)